LAYASAWVELVFERFATLSACWASFITFAGLTVETPKAGATDPATSSAAHVRTHASSRLFREIGRILGLPALLVPTGS
jgi:hypothetical protein